MESATAPRPVGDRVLWSFRRFLEVQFLDLGRAPLWVIASPLAVRLYRLDILVITGNVIELFVLFQKERERYPLAPKQSPRGFSSRTIPTPRRSIQGKFDATQHLG